jgi:PAS domain S-box-containing protein
MLAPVRAAEGIMDWKGMSDSAILEQLGEGVIIINRDFRVVYFNRRAEEITQYLRHEALGKTCQEILCLPNCEEACPVARFLEGSENIVDYEAIFTTRKGKRVPILIRFSLVRDPEEGFSGGIITIRDIPSKRLLVDDDSEYAFQGIISKNQRILQIFEILPDVSRTDASVLIQGESGTGKELFATAIHTLSLRQKGPFIKLNCAALPETLLESELFGYTRGAFTDAKRDKPGMFSLAHRGTLFLDEIGDISPALQVKFLRAVQEGEFIPLGSTQTVRVDVRIISATNRNLEEMVQAQRFRRDLYYRLNVVKIHLPPLRERPEDIPLLTRHLISKIQAKTGQTVQGITPNALGVLQRYDFPGNVRELENIIEHAFILCKEGIIQRRHLPSYLFGLEQELTRIPASQGRMKEMEARTIADVLNKYRGNKVKAARELGVHRTTLWRKMRRMTP